MNWFDQCRQDVSYAARTFTRAPGFALLVVLTLALGIGAASSMFSVVNALILHPLPFPNANRLVVIWEKFVNEPDRPPVFDTYRDFENWQRGSHSFERMAPATWSTGGGVMTGAGPAREVLALPVGLDFFPLLGIAPELGRTFESNDLNSACTLVLKYSFWIETFGGQSNIAGRRIQLNQDACTIVGVMPREFAFYPEAAEMWRLITPGSPIVRDPKSTVGVFALLKPGVSIQRAQQEVAAIYKGAPTNDLGTMHVTPVIYPLAEQFAYLTGPTLRLSVAVLFGSVGFVLFIACLNIANLLLGKSVARQKEMAVRAALGSDRARIVRQLLTESLLLAVAGAALGTLAAVAAVHYFRVLKPVALPPGNPVAVNLPVLAFSASLAVLTAVLFGLVPALKASRVDLVEALRVSAQSASLSRAARTFRRALVVAEVALSLALLAGAGLLVESLAKLASVPLGFRTDHLAVIPVNLPHWAYPTASQRARFYGSALDRAALVSGQISAAFANALPPDGQVGRRPLAVEGRPEPTLTPASFNVGQISISPDYFRVMGVRMELGRTFDKADIDKSPAVAIVNDALARQYFPHENPIGKRIRLPERGADAPWLTIVGVSASEKGQDFFHPMNWQETPIVFRPMNQDPPSRVYLVLAARNGTPPAAEVQKEIAKLDRSVAIGEVETMNQRLSRSLAYPHLRAIILAIFAGLALLLAAIGLYAVLSQLNAQRTQEFGIRMALGAQSRDLLKLVIREGMALAFAGLLLGLALTWSLTGLLSSLLYGVKPGDPVTLGGVSLLLLLVTLLAAYVPARRASRVDPKVALRYE